VSLLDFEGIATHEAGHAHGLDHSAWDDSFDNDTPTMTSGCSLGLQFSVDEEDAAQYAGRWVSLERDDGAAFLSIFDLDLHANAGWEDGGSWTSDLWKATGGASINNITGTGAPGNGTHYGKLGPGGNLRQRVRISDPGDAKGRVYHRKANSSDTGTISILIKARELDYDLTGPCTSGYLNNWDLDNPAFPNGTQMVTYDTKTVTPGNSWTDSETTAFDEADGWDDVDLRIRVENNMSTPGVGPAYVHLDRLRARHLP